MFCSLKLATVTVVTELISVNPVLTSWCHLACMVCYQHWWCPNPAVV